MKIVVPPVHVRAAVAEAKVCLPDIPQHPREANLHCSAKALDLRG